MTVREQQEPAPEGQESAAGNRQDTDVSTTDLHGSGISTADLHGSGGDIGAEDLHGSGESGR